MSEPVVIVGAGISGLIAALTLQNKNVPVRLVEKAHVVGGRLRTNHHEGYLLDEGFQVLLSAYPAVQKYLDLNRLTTYAYAPGANILLPGGKSTRISDPLRRPQDTLKTMLSPVGSFSDKLRLLRLVTFVKTRSSEELFKTEEQSTADFLEEWGFSARMIDRFFRPFYGGIFLERNLETSSRMFLFTFKMFAEGKAVLPKGGIQKVAEQLAEQLEDNVLLLNSTVANVTSTSVELGTGEVLNATRVIDTRPLTTKNKLKWNTTVNVYFSTPTTKLPKEVITLLPGGCPVNNLSVVSGIDPGLSPHGEQLISVSLYAPFGKTLDFYANEVRKSLKPWFAAELGQWKALHHYQINMALPFSTHVKWEDDAKSWKNENGIYLAGDHRLSPSLQGAMKAGELVALEVSKTL